MEACSELDPKYLLGQLNTARKEINNLRQQVKSLGYILEKDVNGIKDAIKSYVNGKSHELLSSSQEEAGPSTEMDNALKMKPIGVINTGFPSKRATPRQPGICKGSPGKVTLFNSTFTNPEHALAGLQEFSHMWILFYFHRNDSTHVRAKVAPPRLNGVRTGVFSTRSPHRPCPIGLSLVKIVKIEKNVIYFEGVDMVNETPVLDVKPYIPQYDNPLHIEKLLVRPSEDGSNRISEASDVRERIMRYENSLESASVDQRSHPIFINLDGSFESRRVSGAREVPNISRDEEIALRLQAEEFESNPNLEDHRIRNYFSPSEEYLSENSYSLTDANNGSPLNFEQGFGSLVLEMRTNSLSENPTNRSSEALNRDDSATVDVSRSSRLLDGADGPSTICGTDMDLINRRALNTRPDNSPIRMGVREAPDGEEGLESQPLTPSQTVTNINTISLATSNNIPEIGVDHENLARASNYRSDTFEVRVPEWISRPRTPSLSVIFNERALVQLNEIIGDKTEEQKRAIESVLREDPRSVYLRQRWGNQFYTFLIHDLHISCRFDDNHAIVTVFQIRHAGRTCECGEPEWQCLGHSPLT